MEVTKRNRQQNNVGRMVLCYFKNFSV